MKTLVLFGLPAGLVLLVRLILEISPALAAAGGGAALHATPAVIFTVSCLFGLFFTQSRIAFMSVLFAVISYAVCSSFFAAAEDGNRGMAVVFLASVYMPPLCAILYHFKEGGMLNELGYVKGGLVFSAALVILLLPGMDSLSRGIATMEHPLLRATPFLPVSLLGTMFFAGCIPFLLVRNKHESPMMGPILGAGLLFFYVALSFNSAFWRSGHGHAVFLFFSSVSGFCLAAAVLETMWRNAHIDELTELPGRQALKRHLARLPRDFVIAVLDLDHFKKINDKYGHTTGDQVLRFVAAFLKGIGEGKAYRYGGEEFVIVYDGGTVEDRAVKLDELRKAIERREFLARGKDRPRKKQERNPVFSEDSPKESISVTVSIGVAGSRKNGHPPTEVLGEADKALYRAKADGRNRVRTAR